MIESLENRRLFAVTYTVQDQVLTVTGTANAEVASIIVQPDDSNGIDADPYPEISVDDEEIDEDILYIHVDMLGGDDELEYYLDATGGCVSDGTVNLGDGDDILNLIAAYTTSDFLFNGGNGDDDMFQTSNGGGVFNGGDGADDYYLQLAPNWSMDVCSGPGGSAADNDRLFIDEIDRTSDIDTNPNPGVTEFNVYIGRHGSGVYYVGEEDMPDWTVE